MFDESTVVVRGDFHVVVQSFKIICCVNSNKKTIVFKFWRNFYLDELTLLLLRRLSSS